MTVRDLLKKIPIDALDAEMHVHLYSGDEDLDIEIKETPDVRFVEFCDNANIGGRWVVGAGNPCKEVHITFNLGGR